MSNVVMNKNIERAVWCVVRHGYGGVVFLCGPWGAVSVKSANQDMQNGAKYYTERFDKKGFFLTSTELTHYGDEYITTKGNQIADDKLIFMPELKVLDFIDKLEDGNQIKEMLEEGILVMLEDL